ncbi:threonyl-trna synthetase [Lasius niger]|uniref:threonine--tRNA ligase n=1 Tax=Lasius niger TaxID=67767 RepID=A0A0J7KIH6_LASNI|nr:threonyl-trna synthetase [Lasius niger]
MVVITLPDGNTRQFGNPVTGAEVALSIGASLAKAALAMAVDGHLKDISEVIAQDAKIRFITRKDPEALELIRHDAAHVLAEAVQELWPGTQVTIGPSIKDGFYYDFERSEPFTPADFDAIEAKMKEIIALKRPFEREVWDRQKALAFFKEKGEIFKGELIENLPAGEDLSIYRQGEWLDLCRGPHLRHTGDIGTAFKLMRVAGAYWRGDHHNPMLTRIYGTAWRDEKELKAYLHRLEEAEKRDHRRIGKQMDLYHLQEEAPGQIFWHAKGWNVYNALQNYMRRLQTRYGYQEVKTPQLLDRFFWERSGHWEKYRENMYLAHVDEEDKLFALKPMNCPCHVEIFRHGLRSYRELPLRMAEFGSCHRYEPSGALHGIMRVRAFTQDDAHIFCEEDQIAAETARFVEMLSEAYKDLGFEKFSVKFSDRPETRAGSDETWDRAEGALKKACGIAGVEYELNKGEGAFYGPKLEFVLTDALGREWQCGTLQVDYVLPERLDVSYIGRDGNRHRPVMLHRAILGSFERFLGILIEEHAGKFPLWLAPVQAAVATIVSDANEYAEDVAQKLEKAGLSVHRHFENDKINAKIRDLSLQKIPFILAIGRKEAEEGTVSIRELGSQKNTVISLDEAIELLKNRSIAPDLERMGHIS